MIIKLFDNIGASFSFADDDNDRNFLPGVALSGYNAFDSSHVGSRISYLARNVGDTFLEFEVGLGDIIDNNGTITILRSVILASSSNNEKVSFSVAGTKSIYVDISEVSTKTAFNNVLEKNSDFTAIDYQTTYIVDLSSSNITATLPESNNFNLGLTLSFKTLNTETSGNGLTITSTNSQTIDNSLQNDTHSSDTYVRYISTGTGWQSLQQDLTLETGVPRGDTYALQHNAGGGNFGANNISTNENGDFFVGDTTVLSQQSNNQINRTFQAVDTVIYGDDSSKNLYFSSAGNIGINMPSGYIPQAPLQILQGSPGESIRVESRQNSNPATLTIYHRPSTSPVSGDINAIINLSGKDSIAAQSDYTVLKSKILNSTNGVTTGAFEVDAQYNGVASNILSISKETSSLGSDNTVSSSNFVVGSTNTVAGSGNVVFGQNSSTDVDNSVVLINNNNSVHINDNIEIKHGDQTKMSVTSDSVNVMGSVVAKDFMFSDTVDDGLIVYSSGNKLVTGTSNINNIFDGNNDGLLIKTSDGQASASSDLYVNSIGLVLDSTVVLPQLQNNSLLSSENGVLSEYTGVGLSSDSVEFNVDAVFTNGLVIDPDTTASNYAVLTHNGNGVASWQNINLIDIVIENTDIKWNKYNARNATVSETRSQLILNDSYIPEEFSVGDDVAIVDQDTIYYSTISSISTQNGIVFSLGSAIEGGFATCNFYSINKGGYLNIGLNNSGNINSSISTISGREGVATVFNNKQYNIDYTINGSATNPALHIQALSSTGQDYSPVIVNGTETQTMADGTEATVTVNGGLHATKLQSDDLYLDGGVIEFNG